MADLSLSHQFDFEEEPVNPAALSNPGVDVCMVDNPPLEEDVMADEHGLVDMQTFNNISARFFVMHANFTTLNATITKLMELVATFMKTQSPGAGHADVAMPPAGAPPLVTPPVTEDVTLHVSSAPDPKEAVEMLKSMKAPVFWGEDKDQNKDTVNTFLSKWANLHDMRNTHDVMRPWHTSLTLEGKAYKWWMAYKDSQQSKTWAEFEAEGVSSFQREAKKLEGLGHMQAETSLADPVYLDVPRYYPQT